jgi:hypothetical protein
MRTTPARSIVAVKAIGVTGWNLSESKFVLLRAWAKAAICSQRASPIRQEQNRTEANLH